LVFLITLYNRDRHTPLQSPAPFTETLDIQKAKTFSTPVKANPRPKTLPEEKPTSAEVS